MLDHIAVDNLETRQCVRCGAGYQCRSSSTARACRACKPALSWATRRAKHGPTGVIKRVLADDLTAMAQGTELLESLNPDDRRRVVRYLWDRFGEGTA